MLGLGECLGNRLARTACMQVKAWLYIENNTGDEQEQQKEISRAETISTASQIWHESNSGTSIAKQSHGDVKTPAHEG